MKRFFSPKLNLLLVLIIFFNSGCVTTEQKKQHINGQTIEDRTGRTVTVSKKITKIISLAPAITQTLIDLGLKDNIVAVDSNSAAMFPGLPNDIPALDMLNPNIENMSLLKPELILASTITAKDNLNNDPLAKLKDLNFPVAYIPTSNSIEDIKKDVLFIANIVNKKTSGKQLVTNMEMEIENVKELVAKNPYPKKIYFEISSAPNMYSFGKGVFLNEMLEILGTTNIFATQKAWFPVEEESVITANPDIIFTNVNYISDPTTEIMNRTGWSEITAIKENKVYYIDNTLTSLPNTHITTALKEMAQILYEK